MNDFSGEVYYLQGSYTDTYQTGRRISVRDTLRELFVFGKGPIYTPNLRYRTLSTAIIIQ